MTPINCPCCRAANTEGPNCRRCTADLSQLFQLELRRAFLLATAREELRTLRGHEALALLAEAEQLRPGDDLRPLRATAHLLNRDFPAAFRTARVSS